MSDEPRMSGDTVRCARCRLYKALDQFARSSSSSTGVQSYCRACDAASARERRRKVVRPDRRLGLQAATYAPPADLGQVGYLAGLIDGEGTIVRAKRGRVEAKPYWQVIVIMTHRPTIEWLASFGGTFEVLPLRTGPSGEPWRQQYRWRLTAQANVRACLRAAVPYMITKQEIAQQALAEIDSRWSDDGSVIAA